MSGRKTRTLTRRERRRANQQRFWTRRMVGRPLPQRADLAYDRVRAVVHQAPKGRRDEAWQWLIDAVDEIRMQIAGMTERHRSQIHTGNTTRTRRVPTRVGATRTRARGEV